MEAVINDYISRELVQDASLLPLGNTTPLLETGILDSLSLLRLVIFVQERFGIVVDDLDLVPEHFASVDDICAYLRSGAGRESGPGKRPWLRRRCRGRVVAAARPRASAYWLAVAPLAARLPARLAYRVACWRGDWTSRSWPEKRSEITANLRQVLGEELSADEAERLARDLFRFRSCEVIDVMRLRGRARSLARLVEIRGREHLEAALAGGKGAILCSAHFGSHQSAFSLLHASGFPLTTIGRWGWKYDTGVSPGRAAVLGLRVRPARAAPPAAAEHRAVAGPGPGRGAGRSRAPRQRGGDDLQRRRAALR